MFEAGAGFSEYQLKVLISGIVLGLIYTWGALNAKGQFALFSDDHIKGFDLMQSMIRISIICLSMTAFIALNF